MPILAEKKSVPFTEDTNTLNQINYTRIALKSAILKKNIEIFKNFNPEEDIEEPAPEECPELLCPECKKKMYLITYSPTGLPEDSCEYFECENGHSTRKETPQFTPESIEKELLKVPFENCEEVEVG